ncbi:hypothetical protein J3A83DRAFT_4077478, partial [Scleroderma citrinum]
FLPAYLPNFNPIELSISSIKANVCYHYPHLSHYNATGVGPADVADVYQMLFDVVYLITPGQAQAFYHHSGY